jgi:HEXXH motif-containing protein
MQSFLQRLHALSALDALRLFDDWWAGCLFAAPVHHATADINPAINDDHRLTWLFVASIVAGGEGAFTVCPPRAARGAGGWLYLADQHALFQVEQGPAAGFAESGRMRFVRADGAALTYRPDMPIPRGRHAGGRVHAMEAIAGWPVLNGLPIMARLDGVQLASASAMARLLRNVAAGVELLERAWPAAAAFATRALRGIVVLENPGAARSHSGPRMPQVLMCTAERPELVAEALCHELSHVRMNTLLEQGPLLDEADTSVHASPWRSDPRPLIGLVHGVHAFLNVRMFYERLGRVGGDHETAAARIVATQTAKIRAAWDILERHAHWTTEGEAVASDLKTAVEEL